MRTVWVLLLLALVGGCLGPGYERMVSDRVDEKITAWEKKNPGQQITEAQLAAIKAEAVAEVKAELMTEYGESSIGTITSIGSGNFVAAGFHALGLLGLFLGFKKKKAVTA